MKRFTLEEKPPARRDPIVLLVVALIKSMNDSQRTELAQRLVEEDNR